MLKSEVNGIHFIADLHLGHVRVAHRRGFESTEDHDDYLIEQLLDLPQRSTLWILGDLERGSDRAYALNRLKHVADSRDVTMHLVAGNHDACHPMHRRSPRRQREYFEVFESVQAFGTIRHNRQEVLLSHFPYIGDHTEKDRFTQWRLRDYGAPLIHGHTHQDTPTVAARPNQVCVSWEAWARPASLHEVVAEFSSAAASSSFAS